MADRCPVLDPHGRDIHAEAARLRAMGSAVRVELPDGVVAWAVNGYSAIERLLGDPNVGRPAGLIDSPFSPDRIRTRVEELVDGLATAAPSEVVDLRERFAYPLVADPQVINTAGGAGSATLVNFFDNAITALLSHPDQLELVTSGRRSWDDVVDETLRVQSPIAYLPIRYAAEDIELGDVTIPRGDPILVNCAAYGRDPALHGETATEFDISREDKRHLSFGRCPAVELARLVATIGLAVLFERFPDASLVVPVAQLLPLPTFTMNGHRALPVRLTTLATSDAWAA